MLWNDCGPLFHELPRRLTQEEEEIVMDDDSEVLWGLINALFSANKIMRDFCLELLHVGARRVTSATITEACLRIWRYEIQASKQTLKQALVDIDREDMYHYVDEYFEGKYMYSINYKLER